MNLVVTIIQVVLSILLIGSILLQAKGTGLGTAFGGSGEFYHTRRGVEQILFVLTIILIVAFFAISIVNIALF
ncbi:preprotein translocase subunit SecG [Candidatus Beckwithbacteria bacterium RBG_13_42_9]|uniref:Protein-export membrane protein SecG n=1 Tax=Candidatus Beckwithbacteria bacterium RBG_13_42_9 TaxID=1797457 RepID=A0A1F5E938_9BACT|nr:MAG: preprotein translocase subunit SecG [Candidatus Beckwithbacteria bacterium RBG_13_42_9]